MNYHSLADIDPTKDLTVTNVVLFQRFRQDADLKTVNDLLEAELQRHIRLCELSILYHAQCDIYWADLPKHPIVDITTWAFEHLRKHGFEITHETQGEQQGRPARGDYLRWTARWLTAPLKAESEAEWDRRQLLEDEARARHPPTPLSKIQGDEVEPNGAIWAGVLDKTVLAEVQRIHGRTFLCLFTLPEGTCRHCEPTGAAFGARFGPDVGDLAEWQARAEAIVAFWRDKDAGN